MASGCGFLTLSAGWGLALACLAAGPAEAQFMTGSYPVLIVPPPAQSLVMPKPVKLKQTMPPPAPPTDAAAPDQLKCRYQGQTKICD